MFDFHALDDMRMCLLVGPFSDRSSTTPSRSQAIILNIARDGPRSTANGASKQSMWSVVSRRVDAWTTHHLALLVRPSPVQHFPYCTSTVLGTSAFFSLRHHLRVVGLLMSRHGQAQIPVSRTSTWLVMTTLKASEADTSSLAQRSFLPLHNQMDHGVLCFDLLRSAIFFFFRGDVVSLGTKKEMQKIYMTTR